MQPTRIFRILGIAVVSLSPVLAQSQDSWNRTNSGDPSGGFTQTDPAYAAAGQNSAPQTNAQGLPAQNVAQAPQSAPDAPPPPPPPPSYNQQNPYPGNNYPNNQNNGYPSNPRWQSGSYPNGGYPNGGYQNYPERPYVPVPATLQLTPGKYITVRVNSFLTTDHNQAGDPFIASLVEPIVIDGFVVARRGEMVHGRVVDVKKAGRVSGTSSMQVEINEVTLVDGQQLPLHTMLVSRNGDTSVGSDVGAVAGTTALGAIVGAAATGSGFGAGMGAIGGAVVGTIGVLATRGRPAVITPETVLTFRVVDPVTISTEHSQQAFMQVTPQDYQMQMRGPRGPGYGYAPPVAAVGYPAYAYPYPYVGGVYFWGGPRFYGRFGYRRW